MAFALPPFLSSKHYTPHLFCKIIVIIQKLILLCTRLLLCCRRLGVRLCLDVIVLVRCLFLRNLLHIFVSVSSSRCGVIILVRCLPLRDLLHVFISVSSFRYGVFLYTISYTSSSRLLPLWQSSTRLFCGLLVISSYGVFVLVIFAMAISYISLPECIPLPQSPTNLCLGVFRYRDLLYVFCDYLAKGDQLL